MKKFVIIITSLFVILAAALSILAASSSKPAIAFYRIDTKTQNVILDFCNKSQTKKSFNAITLNPELPLSEQKKDIKKSTILFTKATLEAQIFAKNNGVSFSAEFLNGFPSSIIKSILPEEKKLYTLPLLYDFYLTEINYDFYSNSGLKQLNTFDDLTAYIKTQKDKPFTAAFKNPEDFINILSALSLSFITQTQYQQLLQGFYSAAQNKTVEEYAKQVCSENGLLHETILVLQQMFKEGLISSESLRYENANVTSLLDRKNCSGAFESLSQHRKIDHKSINTYTSIFIPSKEFTVNRQFVAPEISAVCLKKNKKSGLKIITSLSQKDQTALSTLTGLAPVQKNCAVADKQSDDVRYWIAASDGPALPLSYAFTNYADLKSAAETIKAELKF